MVNAIKCVDKPQPTHLVPECGAVLGLCVVKMNFKHRVMYTVLRAVVAIFKDELPVLNAKYAALMR